MGLPSIYNIVLVLVCISTGSLCHACVGVRPLQLCGFHEKKDIQFYDQGKRAGKQEILDEKLQNDPESYAKLLCQYSETHLDFTL